jgi:hypothetical protein
MFSDNDDFDQIIGYDYLDDNSYTDEPDALEYYEPIPCRYCDSKDTYNGICVECENDMLFNRYSS